MLVSPTVKQNIVFRIDSNKKRAFDVNSAIFILIQFNLVYYFTSNIHFITHIKSLLVLFNMIADKIRYLRAYSAK